MEEKKEELFKVGAVNNAVIVKELPAPKEAVSKSNIHLLGTSDSGIDPANVKATVDKYESHPWTGLVVASDLVGVKPGDIVCYGVTAAINKSAYIKVNGQLLKVLRPSDIQCTVS